MKKCCLVPSIILCSLTCASFAAQPVHLTLVGKEQGWIQGETTISRPGVENTIEALAYTHMVAAEPDPKTGRAGDVRNHYPITILKRIDKASPRLFQAWRNGEPCTATFRFYRPNPSGDGTIQHFYTVVLKGAQISGIRRQVPSAFDSASASSPPVERVSFTYGLITEIYHPDGDFESSDDWRASTAKIPLSDVNFDGIVNMKDFVILADDWMTQY
ncbi:MAG: type VI secretion system tube protein Hcp [Phycisphaerae bacterium]|nr:type VI secretion system tube protein Hcp [Phycisphaerae bacterium]